MNAISPAGQRIRHLLRRGHVYAMNEDLRRILWLGAKCNFANTFATVLLGYASSETDSDVIEELLGASRRCSQRGDEC